MALKSDRKKGTEKDPGRLKWAMAILIAGSMMVVLLVLPLSPELLLGVELVTPSDVLLIDPGHGGMDGGAESSSGVSEKDINLAIALEIKELAEKDGWKVVMTREEDKGLYKEDKKRTIRSMKTEDLKARKQMVDETEPLVAVSIHLNSFKQDRSVHGAQTFYPAGTGDEDVLEESQALAEAIQANLIEGLQDGTERVALGKKDVMLFKNPTVPTVIVECGFLSNRQEAELLQSEEYQKELAEYIYNGIMKHCGKEQRPPITIVDNKG